MLYEALMSVSPCAVEMICVPIECNEIEKAADKHIAIGASADSGKVSYETKEILMDADSNVCEGKRI